VIDSFLERQNRRVVIDFKDGKAAVAEGEVADVDITIEIADLSSLLMGVIPFGKLYQYGRVEISHSEKVTEINRLFYAMKKPICTTAF
jgi:predicted acetyltransferase